MPSETMTPAATGSPVAGAAPVNTFASAPSTSAVASAAPAGPKSPWPQRRRSAIGTMVSQAAKQGQTVIANQQAPIVTRIADLAAMTVQAQVTTQARKLLRLAAGLDQPVQGARRRLEAAGGAAMTLAA